MAWCFSTRASVATVLTTHPCVSWCLRVNTVRLRQNSHHVADNIWRCIFLNENVWISIVISQKFVPKGLINNIPALIQIMAWCRPGNKSLFEPLMVTLLTHLCVTLPQWVTWFKWINMIMKRTNAASNLIFHGKPMVVMMLTLLLWQPMVRPVTRKLA